MKNALAIVTLSALLPALAATAQAQPASTIHSPLARSAQVTTTPASATTEKQTPANPSLPANNLTEELMFKLLRAEMAYQRGDWQLAFVTMLISAQETRDPRLARRAAEIALSVKQTGEALSAVRLWRQLDPDSDEASQFYLGLVVLGENLAEAKPIFVERLQEVRPQARGLLILQIQRLLAGVKDKQGAFNLMEELVTPYGNLVESHIALAQAAFANNDTARAQQEALTALKIKPDLEIAVLMAAQTMQNRSQTLSFLDDHLKKYPKAREIRIAYAKVLIDDKQQEKAREQFEILLKDQPRDLTILYAMGILGAQMNDRPMAEKYLTAYLKELEANPDETRDPVQALMILAQIAADRKDYPAALKWLAQVEPGPAYLEAQVKSAQIMAQSGDIDGAHNVLSHLKPEGQAEQIQILIADAQLMRDANRMPEAMAIMENGLKTFPDDTGLLYDYAMLAEKAQRFDKMETALRKIIQLAPDNQHAYNALGYSLADRNVRLQEALKLLQKASELAPEDPFIMDSVGWVYFRLGRLAEAEDYLRRAYAIRPDAEIGVHLGEVLWVKGQKDDAHNLWRAAQQKDPDNETLRSTLTRLRISL
ncbi:MAG: tetratricopeptide repeat protein [Oxalicibacterium faecigallinarum]|uniref:tetratricopeptide repeat protein n=1 Tax=Oxalicibacterium faecigallinarum TaxID=573741 RepID=UPI002808EDAF|nr:tetratricopeptide repeat protein [Oxalicibacterium faecigallinarum]MDQ7968506.1 tetratricopeptide repeat protein [Oxalicibacterium faecigallinarum]